MGRDGTQGGLAEVVLLVNTLSNLNSDLPLKGRHGSKRLIACFILHSPAIISLEFNKAHFSLGFLA